jgi:hypothetical protein
MAPFAERTENNIGINETGNQCAHEDDQEGDPKWLCEAKPIQSFHA